MKKIFVLFAPFWAFNAQASFVSDLVSDLESNLAPDYFESQGRGYATFGSYSARSKNVVLNPVSITPPSINIGCNGIDIVGGGISFLGEQDLKRLYDQLVNPNTLMYVGTSMAMKMLSNELAGSVETAMDMIQQINAMQLDGCGIANAGVSYITDSSYRASANMKMNRAVDDVSDFVNNNVFRASKDQEGTSPSKVAATKGKINAKLTNFSGKAYFVNGGSLLEFVLKEWPSASPATAAFAFPAKVDVDQLRALYGDIFYDVANKESVRIVAPCEMYLDDLEAQYYSKGSAAGAGCATVSGNSIRQYASDGMVNLFNAYQGDADIDKEFVGAIQNTNVLVMVKNDAGQGKAYLTNSLSAFKSIASMELAYQYADVYYQDMVSQLEKFKEEAKAFAGEYGDVLGGGIEKLIRDAERRHRLFETQKQYALTRFNEFLGTREKIEAFPSHGNNPLYKILNGVEE